MKQHDKTRSTKYRTKHVKRKGTSARPNTGGKAKTKKKTTKHMLNDYPS